MKVLEKGRPKGPMTLTLVCTGEGNNHEGCGAKLLVSHTDVYVTESDAQGETDRYHTFCCPECGAETDITGWPGLVPKGKRPSEQKRFAKIRKWELAT